MILHRSNFLTLLVSFFELIGSDCFVHAQN